MVKIPFFGSDDDEPTIDEEIGDVRITSNRDIEVNTATVDELASDSGSSLGGLNVHVVSIDTDDSTASSGTRDRGGSTTGSTGSVSPGSATSSPAQPSAPKTSPTPGDTSYSRGTFALPDERDFMQKLEARGKNGHGSIVETVYVLTGPSYARPTDLVCLDSEKYYGSATRRSVSFYPRKMARKVANLYPEGSAPKLIARFHTHPGGSVTPSSADKNSAPAVREAFVDAFGTDNFEFFHGIHALEEHGRHPGPDERQRPRAHPGQVSWVGERYRHKLALFGRKFQTPKTVAIDGGD